MFVIEKKMIRKSTIMFFFIFILIKMFQQMNVLTSLITYNI